MQPLPPGFQLDRSLLAAPKDLTVRFGATKINKVIATRKLNTEKYESVQDLPELNRVLVIGAGCSMSIFVDMYINFDDYDGIILTHPMVKHYSYLLDRENVYVVDCEYQPISEHYYDEWASKINLICRLGKEITADYKQITWILPEGRKYNINEVGELVPELPYSTGAMALWYALNKFGKDCKGNYVGIDNDGVVCRYWNETRKVMRGNESRLKNLGIRLFEWGVEGDEV